MADSAPRDGSMSDEARPDEPGVAIPVLTPVAFDARTRVETFTHDSDFTRVASLLAAQRDAILTRWLEASAAQQFHAGQSQRVVADHIPALFDAVIAVLFRVADPTLNAGSALHESAVLAAAQAHALARTGQGLSASDIVTEFRLLRQEIGRAIRQGVSNSTPTQEVVAAELVVHDALDDAVFVTLTAISERDEERRRLLEELLTEQRRLNAVLEQMPAAVLIAEAPLGQIAIHNRQVKSILGDAASNVTIENPMGGVRYFYRDGRPYAHDQHPLSRAVRTGEVVTGEELNYIRPDGSMGALSVNAAPIRDDTGKVTAAVAIITDITERKSLEQEKEALLATITHDLKNPLTAIKGIAQILQRRVVRGTIETDDLVDRLGRIVSTARSMERQFDELQDVAKLRTGQAIELHRGPTELIALVTDVVARHQAASMHHTLEMTASVPELMGEWDAGRLERVIDNLLGNALKFSPAGGQITVTVTVEANPVDRDDGDVAVVRVSDEGIGIPAEELEHVFEWFRRASNAVNAIPGTGIGLAAARQIVELHGGSISVESHDGAGSTFAMWLPVSSSALPGRRTEGDDEARGAGAG